LRRQSADCSVLRQLVLHGCGSCCWWGLLLLRRLEALNSYLVIINSNNVIFKQSLLYGESFVTQRDFSRCMSNWPPASWMWSAVLYFNLIFWKLFKIDDISRWNLENFESASSMVALSLGLTCLIYTRYKFTKNSVQCKFLKSRLVYKSEKLFLVFKTT